MVDYPRHTRSGQRGFTLIELSIVLVIIGLIVGGVLVGQDLIRAAEIRATVGQIEKYNASVNTFRSKYDSIPGDMLTTNAAAFGFFTDTTTGIGHGDGNSIIEGGSSGGLVALGETIEFWRHLTDANLIDGSFGTSGNGGLGATSGTGAVASAVTNIAQSVPPAKLGRNNYVIVYSLNGINYYQIGSFSGFATSGVYTAGAYAMTPIESYNIDAKIDDGMPNTGLVQANLTNAANVTPNTPASVAASSTASTCTIGTGIATDTYNRVTGTGGTDPSCSLRIRFN